MFFGMDGFFQPSGHFEGREPSSLPPTVLNMANETRLQIITQIYRLNHLETGGKYKIPLPCFLCDLCASVVKFYNENEANYYHISIVFGVLNSTGVRP
jgi:hypothetical protein